MGGARVLTLTGRADHCLHHNVLSSRGRISMRRHRTRCWRG